MDRWEYFNPNPVKDKRTGDCVVRAICKATGFDWETVFAGLMIQACTLSDMPSANYVWGAYLYKHGYRRKLIEQSERYIYTVNDFCADHPTGTYILCIDGHVVTVQEGKYFDHGIAETKYRFIIGKKMDKYPLLCFIVFPHKTFVSSTFTTTATTDAIFSTVYVVCGIFCATPLSDKMIV